MDALSHLFQLARPQSTLDLRCQFAGGFAIDHEPSPDGVAPFHLVLAGHCVIETATGQRLSMQAGDFVLFPKGGTHRLRNSRLAAQIEPVTLSHDGMLPLRHSGQSSPDVDLLCGRFLYAPGAASLLIGTLPDPLHVSLAGTQSMAALQALTALMRLEAEQRQPGALAIVTSLSHALLAMALRVHGEQQTGTAGVVALLSDVRLGASVQAMIATPAHPWTIDELGTLAAMSRATYARHFRDKAGMTVLAFLTQLRMAIASDLLLRTQRSAADIGMEVGYQSEAAFGKAFQQYLGLAPGRYRRQHKASR